MHTHPCGDCGRPVECDGARSLNYDGCPEIICSAYHVFGGVNPDCRCEACEAEFKATVARELADQEAE